MKGFFPDFLYPEKAGPKPESEGGKAVTVFSCPPDWIGFQGHFPGHPLVPATFMTGWMLDQAWGPGGPGGAGGGEEGAVYLREARFTSPVRPGDQLTLVREERGRTVRVLLRANGQLAAALRWERGVGEAEMAPPAEKGVEPAPVPAVPQEGLPAGKEELAWWLILAPPMLLAEAILAESAEEITTAGQAQALLLGHAGTRPAPLLALELLLQSGGLLLRRGGENRMGVVAEVTGAVWRGGFEEESRWRARVRRTAREPGERHRFVGWVWSGERRVLAAQFTILITGTELAGQRAELRRGGGPGRAGPGGGTRP